jgi:HEAT repeat protein
MNPTMSVEVDIEQLIQNLRHPDWQVRYDAADQLKVVGDPRAVEPLIDVLQDENLTVQFIAAMTLGIIKDPRAVNPLVAALSRTDDYDTLWALAWALSEMGSLSSEPLIAVLQDGNPLTRDIAADVLGGIGDARALEPLRDALIQHGLADYPETGRYGAADALERFGELSCAMFIAVLSHENPTLRGRAVRGLGALKTPQGVPALIARLDDTATITTNKDEVVRVCDLAAEALKAIDTEDARAALQDWQGR